MQSKTQRKRTSKAPVTPEQAMIDKAVEALVSEGVYTGEEGFRSLIHRISKSYIQAALRGKLMPEAAVTSENDTLIFERANSNISCDDAIMAFTSSGSFRYCPVFNMSSRNRSGES